MLKSIGLKNFKSYQDATFDLGLRNVLVGPNMSGKSNFVDVFKFLKRLSFPTGGMWGLLNAFPGGFTEFTWKGGDSNLISLSLKGREQDQDSDWCYQISIAGSERGHITVQEEIFTAPSANGVSSELIGTKDGLRFLKNKDGRLITAGLEATRAAVEFDLPDWDGSFLRKTISKWHFYKLVPSLMRQPNPASAPVALAETGENLSAWLLLLQTVHGDAFARIQAVCADLLQDIARVFTWPTQQSTVSIASNEKFLRRTIPIWQMSDGELALLALLSLIYCPTELSGSLYCIEEPENHLHPRLIESVVELLKQAQGEPGTLRSQVIATTHSPLLVDSVGVDELVVIQKREGASRVTYPRDKHHLKELLQNKELGLGELYYSGALQSG